MNDFTKMDGADLLEACGTDARMWAKAFCQIFENVEAAALTEDYMTMWFANVIEQTQNLYWRKEAV